LNKQDLESAALNAPVNIKLLVDPDNTNDSLTNELRVDTSMLSGKVSNEVSDGTPGHSMSIEDIVSVASTSNGGIPTA